MALDFKGLSLIKATIDKVRKNAGKPIIDVCVFGYQHLTLSLKELKFILSEDQRKETLVRIDIYSSELLQKNVITYVPLLDMADVLSKKSMLNKLKVDLLGRLEHDLKHGIYVFETEKIFELLGCRHRALDIIKCRDSDIIQNLNEPLAENLHNNFDVVVDGGTIEHCFNAPEAVKSIVKALRVGGAVLHISPLTYTNHGFYNFTPCFFHEFYTANGFVTNRILGGFYRDRGDKRLFDLPATAEYALPPVNCQIYYAASKTRDTGEVVWPIQSIYR